MSAPSDQTPKPKRRRSWWRRVLQYAVVCSLLITVVTVLALKWVYDHRVDLVNRTLIQLGPLKGSITTVDFDREGNLALRDLELTEPETGARVLRLPMVDVKVDWQKLPSGVVKSLSVADPEINLDEKTLTDLLKPNPEKPSAGCFALPFGLSLGQLTVENAKVRFTQNKGASAEVTLSYHAADISVTKAGQIGTGDQELLIEQGALSHHAQNELPLSLQRLHLKGRVRDGFLELDHLTCDQPKILLKPELIALFAGEPKKEATSAAAVTDKESAPFLKGLRIGKVELRKMNLASKDFVKGNASGLVLPDVSGLISYEATKVDWEFSQEPTVFSQRLQGENLDLHPPVGEGHIKAKSALLELAAKGQDKPCAVPRFEVDGLDANWTTELSDWLIPPATKDLSATPVKTSTSPALYVKEANLKDANIHVADPKWMAMELKTKAALNLSEVLFDKDGWHSNQNQSLQLTDGILVYPTPSGKAAPKPFFELPHGELVCKPDTWAKDHRIERLALVQPVVRLRDGNSPWMKPSAAVSPSPAHAEAPSTETPLWELLNFEELIVEKGYVDLLTESDKPLDLHTNLSIHTEKITDGNLHRLVVQDLEARLPTLSKTPFPVVRAASFEAAVELPEMWKQCYIQELHLTGASIEAGQALMSYFETPKDAKVSTDTPVVKDEPKSKDDKVWSCGDMSVAESFVTLERVVPGIPNLRFGVSFEVENAPLTAEEFAKNVAPQRVELANIKIPSPYEPLRAVAELDSIFVDFSLEGLMRKEIDKIEIVSPTLFVGEDLFWYVDFYRKYAANEPTPSPTAVALAANDKELEFTVTESVITHEPPTSQAAWSVKTLQVHSGKLVLAPKGKPLPGFRTPFPFSFTSELNRGIIEADFEIPPDTYTYEQLKLRFEGMKGQVKFNLPVKGADNNLTETFEIDRIRWKDMHVEKAFLTVTYDSAGIYGKFGGSAYEGYVNGQFNVYLDDSFTWDGWIGGKNVQMHEITQKLLPGYLLMDGKVECTVLAQGDMNEVFQADGKFQNHTPGKFSIQSLNQLLASLPPNMASLNKQMTTIGLETMRDFDYDKTLGTFRLYGREGAGKLTFEGPAGSRNFDVNVYDHRWKNDEHEGKTERRPDATP